MTRAAHFVPTLGPNAYLLRPLGLGLLGVWLGTALQLQQAALWPAWAYGLILLVAVVLLPGVAGLARGTRLRGLGQRFVLWAILALLGMAALAYGAAGARALAYQARALNPALEGQDLRLVGVVNAMPLFNEAGLRFRLEVESATQQGKNVAMPKLVQLYWYGGVQAGATNYELEQTPAGLRAGERWQLTARLRAPHGQRNPHGFDYELWLWEQGVQATGYVRASAKDAPPQRLGQAVCCAWERARQGVRDAIFARLADKRLAGVVAALAVGDQAAIERADWDIFRATGVAHLVSISGLHITLFAWFAALVVNRLWRLSSRAMLFWPAQQAALLAGVVLAFCYAWFSGWGVPAQRTVLMLVTVALLKLSGKQWPWPLVLLLAGAVVLLADPWALMQAGFWLSFVAVGVLLASDSRLVSPGVAQVQATEAAALPRRLVWLHRGARAVFVLLREQAAITVALAPLTLLLFQQVSLVGLPANLLAIPWVTLVVTPLALAGALIPALWDWAAGAVAVLMVLLQALAQLSWATWSAAAPPLALAGVAVVGGVLIVLRLRWYWRVLGLVLLLPALLWQPQRPAPGNFDLTAVDIGQGTAVLLRTANHTLLYDAGPRYSREADAGQRVLLPLLRALGERVNTVMASHRDSDHIGGVASVLAQHPQALLLSSLEPGHELLSVAQRSQRCEAAQHWWWDGVRFDILHPAAQDYDKSLRPNARSCVLRVSAPAGAAALLTGDIEQAQENALVLAQAPLRADVLLVPHHGSKTSSSAEFLAAVQPRFALVQAGYRNRYGHPATEVLARYEQLGVRVVNSPACGAAYWRSDQVHELGCERERARRYWQHKPP